MTEKNSKKNLPSTKEKESSPLPMIADADRATYLRLQGFAKRMNHQPRKEKLKKNPLANNSEYLPIGIVEMQLDQDFFGLWQTHSFTTKVIGNEIVGEIVLEVFHPVAQHWIKRIGSAGVMIRMKAESDITVLSNKIKNTLVADYPHLKAECIKNAAKTLGKKYGRDLNRKEFDDFKGQMEDIPSIHEDLKS